MVSVSQSPITSVAFQFKNLLKLKGSMRDFEIDDNLLVTKTWEPLY